MTLTLTLCVQLAIALLVGAGLIAACRWVQRRSELCGRVMLAGVLLRAVMTVFLFWTSYLNLPILRQLHTGDGFWTLAIDATIYYDAAIDAADYGLESVPRGSASPAFVKTLALWMRAVGFSPVSGAYLNLSLHVLLCVMIVAVFKPDGRWREDLPCAVMLAAVSFSPVLIVFGSQAMKDAMFVFLIGALCVTACELLPSLTLNRGGPPRSRAGELVLAAMFLAALYVIAGIRGYYAALTWTALAVVLFVCAWRQRRARLVRYVLVSSLLLAGAWISYEAGADLDYINPYARVISAAWARVKPAAAAGNAPATVSGAAGSMVTMVDRYRSGFVRTPGATSIRPGKRVATSTPSTSAAQEPVASTPTAVEDSAPSSITRRPTPSSRDRIKARVVAVSVGLGLIFVPVSLLKALSIVDFAGGRGLLTITDADTLFMDLTIVAVIALLARRRSAVRDQLPYVGFAVMLAVAAALLMAYIVTNYGTLFRLRLMVAAPLWMLPLALSTRLSRRPDPPSAASGAASRPDDAAARLAARTQASFGYEWTHFHRWDDSGDINFRDYFETADLAALRGGRVLDAGCGMGRHARQMAAHARQVIAVDFSQAIRQAAINTREVGNVDCVQADLLRLPFADETFDYVYSLGVLHHLGNTETAVRALVATVKPGGRLRVYLYWKRHGGAGAVLRVVDAVRVVTTRLPFRLLRWLCGILSAALWLAVILPYRLLLSAGVHRISSWPLFVYTKYPFRILYNDQFDRFSAPLEKRYDPGEVSALLESSGLQDVRVEPRFGWIAEGVKPAGQSPCAG
jgi:SAM-dependent methyltransferase